MPKIGLRMVKTAIAVFLCFMIYLVRSTGIPFYSAIAAVLCMQPELDDSKAKGKSRIISTLIGGLSGMILLFLFQTYLTPEQELLRYTIISLMMIPLIYVTIWIKQPASSYLTCVVFMSVCISHAGDANPILFAINRMIDTLIGIIVAVGVNGFHLPHHKHKEILIEVPFSYLLEDNEQLSTHTRIHCNRLLKEGAKLMITSSQTPPYLLQRIQGIKGHVSYILMDGVLRYEREEQCCTALHTLSYTVWHHIALLLEQQGYAPFLYEVKDELLYIHHGPYEQLVDLAYYQHQHKWQGHCYVSHETAITQCFHQAIVMMMILIPTKQAMRVEQSFKPYLKEVTWVLYDHPFDETIKVLRIYSNAIALADPAQSMQEEMQANQVYKVRKQTIRSTKEIMKEITHVFHHGC